MFYFRLINYNPIGDQKTSLVFMEKVEELNLLHHDPQTFCLHAGRLLLLIPNIWSLINLLLPNKNIVSHNVLTTQYVINNQHNIEVSICKSPLHKVMK